MFGDSIIQCEAALLWLKNNASKELGITVNKIFLSGHSQGGYVVTRLNTMHKTNGDVCTRLENTYGTTSNNPNAYFQRSLLNFTSNFKSDILFVQGLDDSPIQMNLWPTLKQDVTSCSTCQNRQFIEIPGGGHGSLFESITAKTELNNFINSH